MTIWMVEVLENDDAKIWKSCAEDNNDHLHLVIHPEMSSGFYMKTEPRFRVWVRASTAGDAHQKAINKRRVLQRRAIA